MSANSAQSYNCVMIVSLLQSNIFNTIKSVVILAGAALDLVSSQQERNYNGKIYCVTPAQYGGRYIT